jgi:outer membrane protein assembly factor BamB
MEKRPQPTGTLTAREQPRLAEPLISAVAWVVPLAAFFGLAAMLSTSATRAEEPVANAFEGTDLEAEESAGSRDEHAEPSVLLPSDRGKERSLDRARRLATEARWSDAVAILDELLADDGDSFAEASEPSAPRKSVRAEADRTVASLPRAGRDAYLLLVRARADRQLATAIANADATAILTVARRWFHSPAGERAALLAAILAIESGEPLTAATWLDRLADAGGGEFEPSLTLMRALARSQAGDTEDAVGLLETVGRTQGGIARIAGREVSLSTAVARPLAWLANHGGEPAETRAASGDWRQLGGRPARSTTTEASRPLLVPRYRVPLVRHPDEAKQLERRRRATADTGRGLVPAASPLAVGEYLVTHTPLGILAIDFDSGRRLWLASGVPAATADAAEPGWDGTPRPAAGDRGDRTFDDATSGNLASDGRLVFAVESPPEALAAELRLNGFGGRGFLRVAADWHAGNLLSAYDLEAKGAVRWRLPAAGNAGADASAENLPTAWYLGSPLVVADSLFVLVERQGEVALDVLAAADGRLLWSQTLATYDDDEAITNPAARSRRLAGLTPAFAAGVVVCPVGGGCIIAVETTTRSLAWASTYPRTNAAADLLRQEAGGDPAATPIQRSDPCPVIARGRVLVAPFDADLLLCLDARTGTGLWTIPTQGHLRINGVAGDRVIVTRRGGVDAIDFDTGQVAWHWPCPEGTHPSGRGILTSRTLIQPLDSPEVVELDLADGSLRGRSPARGGAIPGNLVPHRGEIVSQGLDSLDVFHQEASLEERIETALATAPEDHWAMYWRAQSAIEQGDVATGLDWLETIAQSPQFQIPPRGIADALERALQRDFSAVRAHWKTTRSSVNAAAAPAVARMLVDGCLAAGDVEAAWTACHSLLAAAPKAPAAAELIQDSSEPFLSLTPDRWLQSRLADVAAAADPELTTRIEAAFMSAVVAASGQDGLPVHHRRLEQLVELLGRHPAAAEARRHLGLEAANDREGAIRRELMDFMALTHDHSGSSRAVPLADSGGPTSALPPDVELAWPLGEVERHRLRRTAAAEGTLGGMQALPIDVIGSGPETRVARALYAIGDRKLIVADRFGRPVGEPVPIPGSWAGGGLPWAREAGLLEVAILGSLLFVRTTESLSCYDLDANNDTDRLLWSRDDFAHAGSSGRIDRWGGGIGSRVARDGGVPLGMRIVEPEDTRSSGSHGLVPLPQGLVVSARGTVAALDPATGNTLWERHRVPPGTAWIADSDYLCGCTASGRGSVVLSLASGRSVEACDLPDRRQRLPITGRRIVAVHSIDDLPGRFTARRVRLDLIDPVGCRVVSLGDFPGESRAVETGDGRLAVMTPDGLLTVLALETGAVVFQTSLPDPPRRFERLVVQSWHDRYLVLAGGADEDEGGGDELSPLQPLLTGPVAMSPLTASVWAISRTDGEPLWPAPAVIERQYLLSMQPEAAPILVFGRLLQAETTTRESLLSVLCLDKRTGHAVAEDERVPIQPHQAFGCQMVADAEAHTVTIAGGESGDRLQLTFTGLPMAPQPPFQSGSRPPSAAGVAGFLRRAWATGSAASPRGSGDRPVEDQSK